ncbi:MAG: NAD-dependent epimerase/dehydratase family protein [Acidobacteria bacterium]|nr:NAD-dependent epimerase/dehydratase family protein [Acidobacteriota bacterium]
MTERKKSILIAGGAGFVASALIESLPASEFDVFGADVFDAPGDPTAVRRLSASNLLVRNLARIEELDLSVGPAVEDLFLRTNPSIVVNLTPLGLGGVPLAPLLSASRKTCAHFIQISCIRAREAGNPWIGVEQEIERSGLPFTILRLAEPCGEGLSGNRFPARCLEDIHAGRPIAVEHGPARDYISPKDAAAATLLAIRKGPSTATFEIGTGAARTQGAIIRILAAAIGRDAVLKVNFGGDFKPPVAASLEAARRDLGFHPSLSIEEQVSSIVGAREARQTESVSTRPARAEPVTPAPDEGEPIRLSRRELFSFLRRPGNR